jgi:hypothetical protein
MQSVELKLKQASAVLGVAPKDLQNLVQFKVLRPPRRDTSIGSTTDFSLRQRWPSI